VISDQYNAVNFVVIYSFSWLYVRLCEMKLIAADKPSCSAVHR